MPATPSLLWSNDGNPLIGTIVPGQTGPIRDTVRALGQLDPAHPYGGPSAGTRFIITGVHVKVDGTGLGYGPGGADIFTLPEIPCNRLAGDGGILASTTHSTEPGAINEGWGGLGPRPSDIPATAAWTQWTELPSLTPAMIAALATGALEGAKVTFEVYGIEVPEWDVPGVVMTGCGPAALTPAANLAAGVSVADVVSGASASPAPGFVRYLIAAEIDIHASGAAGTRSATLYIRPKGSTNTKGTPITTSSSSTPNVGNNNATASYCPKGTGPSQNAALKSWFTWTSDKELAVIAQGQDGDTVDFAVVWVDAKA